tara:strand:+ start:319 stop:2190 length:1872 start_codon:yes stop_codon:yes gene_type:complete
MNFEKYNQLVNSIQIGKHLPSAIYVHEDAFVLLPKPLVDFVCQLSTELKIPRDDWNLLKLYKKDYKYSLLSYPDFLSDSYPELEKSYTVSVAKKTVRKASYAESENPPILHRKELFLNPEHPKVKDFKIITKEGEKIGLYEKTSNIGFKKNWESLIRRKGYILQNGRIIPLRVCNEDECKKPTPIGDIEIKRHKTALSRDKLSVPMQYLARKGYLEGQYTVFDYGCGKGDDLKELISHGLEAYGWDPAYRKDQDVINSDIVNLGYVINVIDDREERTNTLKKAFSLSNKILIISAMIASESIFNKFARYKDGVVTQKNTFQKYYSQGELKNYIEETLNCTAIAVNSGVFIVFKDEIEEQNYLYERQKSHYVWSQYTTKTTTIDIESAETTIFKNRQLFIDFWETLLDLGRIPASDEFEFMSQLKKSAGSIIKAVNVVTKYFGEELFEEAKRIRRDDLLIYFALGFFSKRQAYSRMPEGLQRDIKTFFGKYTSAREKGKLLLFSIAEPGVIYNACLEAHQQLPASQLNGRHDFVFHAQYINQCPKELRVYVGCAIQLYGDIDGVDLIKAHIGSGKVSFMIYDNWDKDVPLLKERIKIKLREQDIDYFDYIDEYKPQPLYNKKYY